MNNVDREFHPSSIRPDTKPTGAPPKPRRSSPTKKAIVLAVIAAFWAVSP